ncbi:beta-galactosidase GalA [Massilia sp. CT11-137]|uniref:beta-galactosidase GalA n=1 Tax=Massilia sp. CT11-137 TaxID=3393901 RepID=UPI0039AF47FF
MMTGHDHRGAWMRAVLHRLLTACAVLLATLQPAHAAPRERLSLDAGWRFLQGDVPLPAIKGHGASYLNAKAGEAQGPANTDYDDSGWRRVDLPHDWAVEGPFDAAQNKSQGYRARGIGWYRRYFTLPASDRGRHIELQFDGVATHSTVWVNGIVVNRNWSGYNGRYIDITPYMRYGAEPNTIAVRVDAEVMEGWWYEGAGIYRHTWLVKRDAMHIATDGIHANPVRKDGRWTLPVTVDVDSSADSARKARLEVSLLDPAGHEVAHAGAPVQVDALGRASTRLALAIRNPQPWTLAGPALYRVRAVLRDATGELDRAETHTGFRTIRFDADRGFFLNGQPTKLQGVAIHQDHAGVGVAVPDSIWEFRLRQLKSMGVNAIRFAHNAPAAEVLDIADRIGLLVMDENRNFNTSPDYMQQLTWLVKRDRNRPSVILWSIFNEETLQGTEIGYEMARRMAGAIKQLDTTRPVTAAMHGGLFAARSAVQALDVAGINYQVWEYDRFHKMYPHKPVFSSEDTSAFMSRGEYTTDQDKHLVASYDDDAAQWGQTQRGSWKQISARPFLAGSFAWTGLDYRGEPTPHEWPSAGSFFGIMDLCALPKNAYWFRQALWLKDRTVVKVMPHWNWAGKEGQPVKVRVATNAPRVRLELNGAVVGEQDVDPFDMATFQVPYAPGRLEAVALKDGAVVGRDQVETSGAPARLVLAPDRPALAGDGADAVPVTVSAVDARGRPVPDANLHVTFDVAGPGAIIGVGNGDPNSHESEKAPERNLYNGLAQVIVQSRRAGRGPLTLRAHADGLQSAALALDVRAVAPIPAVAEAQPLVRPAPWRTSPPQADRPDPNRVLADNDMNTWGWGEPPLKQAPDALPWRSYRVAFGLRSDRNDGHARLVMREIAGKAEVWLDGVRLGEKTAYEPGPLTLAVPKGAGWRTLTVLVQAQPGQPSGLTGDVTIEPGTP